LSTYREAKNRENVREILASSGKKAVPTEVAYVSPRLL
jgi:hypothetical protein